MRQLSGLDATFLHVETPRAPMHLCSVLVYDPTGSPFPPMSHEGLVEHLRGRLDRIPTLRERLVTVPLDLDNPWWVRDASFNLEYHVRALALPPPGNWVQLQQQAARIHARPLDRRRPLWELYLIEGLDAIEGRPPGCFAIMTKVHHSAIDGVSGFQLLEALHDLTPVPAPAEPASVEFEPERVPTDPELVLRAAAVGLRQPFRSLRILGATVPAAARVAGGLRRGELETPSGLGGAPRTRFQGSVDPHRTLGGVDLGLDDVRAVRGAVPGATVNDVALSLVGGALRRLLMDAGELPPKSLVAMVPISVHEGGVDAASGNRVSGMLVSLRSDIGDPLERVAAVRESTAASKSLTNAIGANLLTDYTQFAPSTLASLGGRLASRAALLNQANRLFNTVVTNVPGPRMPLYCRGARLVEHWGFGPVQNGAGILHAVFSHEERLFLAFTTCRTMLPSAAPYEDALRASIDETVGAT